MDGHRHEKGSSFTSGLLLGLLLGIGITLLVVTKKGRKMLKVLTEEGLENMKDLKSRLSAAESMIDDDLFADEVEGESSVPIVSKPVVAEQPIASKTANGVKKSTKKFFRGIPKKS